MPTTWRSRVLLGLAVTAAVVAIVLLTRGMQTAAEVAPPTPTPTPSPTEEAVAQPVPFRVRVTQIGQQPMDTNRLYGRTPVRRPPAARRAARRAATALQRYLNRAFVAEDTRFTNAAMNRLLTRQGANALTRRDRRALGAQPLEIAGGTTRPVRARAIVLHDRGDVVAVSLRYRARMNVVFDDGTRGPLVQRGAMVFVPTDNGWRADMVDVRLRRPRPPAAPADDEPTQGTEPAQETTS